MFKNIRVLIGILAVLALGAGVFFFFSEDTALRWKSAPDSAAGERGGKGEGFSSETPLEDTGIEFEFGEARTDTGQDRYGTGVNGGLREGINPPRLDRPIVFQEGTPPGIAEKTRADIEEVVAVLRENPRSTAHWLRLGLARKGISDYKGAREAWEYAAALDPRNAQAHDNLGVIYGYYLRDTEKAEAHFLRAIEEDPLNTLYYRRSFEFYRDVLKDMALARWILRQGIDKNPGNSDLKTMLEEAR